MIWLFITGLIIVAGSYFLLRERLNTGPPSEPANRASAPMRDCPRCSSRIGLDWAFCPFCARAVAADEDAGLAGDLSLPTA